MATSPSSKLANPTPDPIPVVVGFDQDPATGAFCPCLVRPAGHENATLAIRLFPDEAEGYYLNVTTARPAIFVHWREPAALASPKSDDPTAMILPPQPQALLVTLSYNEAARLLDGGETVDALPMPEEMAAWLTEYVNLHYVPEQKKKKGGRRDRPSFMARDEFGRMAEQEQNLARPYARTGETDDAEASE